MAIIGRYVLPPEIFPILAATKPGKGGEIQLTDGLATLCERHGLAGLEVEGQRHDVGDRAGYVVAMVHYALRRADIADEVRAGITRLLAESAGRGRNVGASGLPRGRGRAARARARSPTAIRARARAAPIGAQVVVPFGARTVTGFVVGARAPAAPDGATTLDIEAVVAGEPAFDEAMIGFCRWVADYYQAPLGEVLRAALPQGEQATRDPRRAPDRAGRRGAGTAAGAAARTPPTRARAGRAGGGGRRAAAAPADARGPRRGAPARRGWSTPGLVEVGDEVQAPAAAADRRATRAPPAMPVDALPKRAAAKRAARRQARRRRRDGVAVASLSDGGARDAARAGRGRPGAHRASGGGARAGGA